MQIHVNVNKEIQIIFKQSDILKNYFIVVLFVWMFCYMCVATCFATCMCTTCL